MRDVFVCIKAVGKGQLVELGQIGCDDLLPWRPAGQQFSAQLGKLEVGLAGGQVIGQAHNVLVIDFKADLRPPDHNGDVGPDPFECANYFRRLSDVPDVNPKLDQAGAGLQLAQVGHQVTQAKGRVNVLRVERAKDDIGHRCIGIYHGAKTVGNGNSRSSVVWPAGGTS